MAEDFQAGVCGSPWWCSPRGSIGSSPCLVAMNDLGSFGWPVDSLLEMKARSVASRDVNNTLPSNGSLLFQDIQKPSEGFQTDSTLEMVDVCLSSSPSSTTTKGWTQSLVSGSGTSESNYQSPVLQGDMDLSRLNLGQKEWNMKDFSLEGGQDSTVNRLKQTSPSQGYSLGPTLPLSSSSYGYPSTLIETLFGDDDQLPLENQTMNFPSMVNYRTNLNQFSPSLPKIPSSLRPPLPKQQAYTHLWNASTAAPSDSSAGFIPSTQPQLLEKSNSHNLKTKSNGGGSVQDLKKSNGEPAFKRPRIETPSPLPTFKVRKEKLGDRVTALQQLVSPFGKTDTASVLQEAIEYIKFLHDQVNVLGAPYMKNGSLAQRQQNYNNSSDSKGQKPDLRSRGLCLVPMSSTYPVASDTAADFWTPTFGGTFR